MSAVHAQITVAGLVPGTVYYYKVGDPTQAAAGGVSSVFSFKVSAPQGGHCTEQGLRKAR